MRVADMKMSVASVGADALRLEHSGSARKDALQLICDQLSAAGWGGMSPILPSMASSWAECGFPSIEMNHSLAASFMCTNIPVESIGDLRMPWRCFWITVPDNLCNAKWILVLKARVDGRLKMLSVHDGFMHYGDEPSIAGYLDGFAGSEHFIEDGVCKDDSQRDSLMVGRLFVGVCAELHDRDVASMPRSSGNSRKRDSSDPTVWTHKLTRPVKVNLSQAVRDFCHGKRGSLSVQSLVRGHWKMQPHGPGLSLRKWIHVEPYWRGPDDAPIAVRVHRL